MKRHLVYTVFWLILCLLASTASAVYTGNKDRSKDQPTPQRIIIKLDASLNVNPVQQKGAAAKIGISAFDNINKKHGVLRQESLLPKMLEHNRPNQLKNLLVIDVPEGKDIFEMIAEYEELAEVEYAEPDWKVELFDTPDDPLFNHQWTLNNTGQGHYEVFRIPGPNNDTLGIVYGTNDADIDALEVHTNPPDNTSTVVVAIVDTGLDLIHPDLAGHIWTNPGEIPGNGIDDDHNGFIDDIHGWDFGGNMADAAPPDLPPEDNDPTDEMGHGTHCAGIVSAAINNGIGVAGVAPTVQIMAVDFYPAMVLSRIIRAVVYASDNGADVISMSWGLPFESTALNDALTHAYTKGIVLCAATGNNGLELYQTPASHEHVIPVGASNNSDLVSDFSNFGDHVSVCAPGVSILSLCATGTDMYGDNEVPEDYREPNVHIIDNYYYLASGTSMACPTVAGVAAYLRAVSPGLKPDAVQQVMESTADDFLDPRGNGSNLPGWDQYSGHGRVNLFNAVNAVPALRTMITSPMQNEIVSGTVVIVGMACGDDFTDYILEYGEGSDPANWTEITISIVPVTAGTLGNWNTALLGLNGVYTLRLRSATTNMSVVTVYVSNEDVATILSPGSSDTLITYTPVVGTAHSPNFSNWTLEYGFGTSPTEWFEISSSSVPADESTLGMWHIDNLTEGQYTLRLTVNTTTGDSTVGFSTSYVQPLFSSQFGWKEPFNDPITVVPNYGDFNGDGDNEIVVGFDEGLKFYSSDGVDITAQMPQVDQNLDFRIPVAAGHLNADGVEDYVIIGFEYSGVSPRTWLHIYKSGETMIKRNIGTTVSFAAYGYGEQSLFPQLFLKDIDNDGIDEILFCTGYYDQDARVYIHNAAGILMYSDSNIPLEYNNGFQCLPADLNDDGYDELFFAGKGILYQEDFSHAILDSLVLDANRFDDFYTMSLQAVDMDFDGRLELVLFGRFEDEIDSHYWTYVIEYNGGLKIKYGWPRDAQILQVDYASPPVFADIDGDERMEYFITWWTFDRSVVNAWDYYGNPIYGTVESPQFAITPNAARTSAPVMADMNGDGELDLCATAGPSALAAIGGYDRERVISWDMNGDVLEGWPLYTVDYAVDTPGCIWRSPVVGDIDGNGYMDLIQTTEDKSLVFIDLEFTDATYNSSNVWAPTYRINRRLNNTGFVNDVDYLFGDADGSGIVDIDDAYYIMNYLYYSGPAPAPLNTGDPNGDGLCNILDITYIIKYVQGTGPEPIEGCMGGGGGRVLNSIFKVADGIASASTSFDGTKTTVEISSDIDIYGLELELMSMNTQTAISRIDGMQLCGQPEAGLTIVGLMDLAGQNCIKAGNSTIIEISGEVELLSVVGVDTNGEQIMIAAKTEGDLALPEVYSLSQNYPNPFNPTTEINFSLPQPGHARLEIFNVLGQKVITLIDAHMTAGHHSVEWGGSKFSSGIYLYRLTSEEFTDTRKMLLLK